MERATNSNDCYISSIDVSGYNFKNTKVIVYANLTSAIRPVGHKLEVLSDCLSLLVILYSLMNQLLITSRTGVTSSVPMSSRKCNTTFVYTSRVKCFSERFGFEKSRNAFF